MPIQSFIEYMFDNYQDITVSNNPYEEDKEHMIKTMNVTPKATVSMMNQIYDETISKG